MEEKLIGAAVVLKHLPPQDLLAVELLRKEYHTLTFLIQTTSDVLQLLLATEVYRRYRGTGEYELVRRDLIPYLRDMKLAERIKKLLKEPQETYEKKLRHEFLSASAITKNAALKALDLYMKTVPERATVFDSVLTARDKALLQPQ